MKVGTIEPLIERDSTEPRKRRSRFFGGGGGREGGNGKDDGGGNNGGGGPRSDDYDTTQQKVPDKSKFVTWFLLLAVLMTFGGMLGAYVVISTNGSSEWRPFELPIQVWISTALIFVSSATYHFAKKALFAGQYDLSRKFLIATTVFGAAFISSQVLVWLELVKRGVYMSGNPYAGFFYILTAAHAIHVAGGIAALGVVILRTWNRTDSTDEAEYRRNLTRSVGWYWHFMGVLWIVLFVMLGFWK